MHAAVIAINDAIDHMKADLTLGSLKNPVALLSNIVDDLMESYQQVLHDAKVTKAQAALSKVIEIKFLHDCRISEQDLKSIVKLIDLYF